MTANQMPELPEGIHPIPRVETEYFKGNVMDREMKIYTLRGTKELVEILESLGTCWNVNYSAEFLAGRILDRIHDWDWDDDYEPAE